MPEHFSFKSYSWSLGTTSFRMANFHRKVEEQLMLLYEFWNNDQNIDRQWSGNSATQVKYYEFIKSKGFVSGDIQDDYSKKAKTARQKTSGLVDIGLIDSDRRLTEVGNKLLSICETGEFSIDNEFHIPSDSFLYFKQLLKTTNILSEGKVRPYLITGIVMESCEDYLTDDEFTYLLPLCVSKETTAAIIEYIHIYRNNNITIDEIIKNVVLTRYNYPAALHYFLNSEKTPEDIMSIGMNRDGIRHDACYVRLYEMLKAVFIDKTYSSIQELFQAARNIKNKAGTMWRALLFKNTRKATEFNDLAYNKFHSITDMNQFDKMFFEYLHLIKIKTNLTDYKDLNRRYLNITDTFLFKDGKVSFTPIFQNYFKTSAGYVFEDAYSECSLLERDCQLSAINEHLVFNNDDVFEVFNQANNVNLVSIEAVYDYIENDRYSRFRELIDEKFPNDVIISMLDDFETRQHDNEIINKVGSDADVPTIFEYIIAVAWYRISGYCGNVLDYMNLSLDSNLLPRTHAGGGMSDIVYRYQATADYPKHDLLIECTLMESSTQRRGEMEPVSRHLLNYMIDVNENSYCTFVSNNLHASVISDFRMRKSFPMYRNDTEHVDGMKIIPLNTSELKVILAKSISYRTLYALFDSAYNDTSVISPPQWYDVTIKNKVFEI